jgi:DNA repair protein RecO
MEIVKSTGIVLSSQVYGESDIACNFYTRDAGKRKFVFKGLKKSNRRSRSATEPGAVASVIYYYRDDRDSYIVNQCDVEKYFSAITGDLEKIFHLYFMLECVDRTCGYNIADEAIYTLLLAGLDALAKTPYPAHCSLFFLLHLLHNHGVLSDVDFCKSCGSGDFPQFILDTSDLRPVCISCSRHSSLDAGRRMPYLPETMLACLRQFLSEKYASISMADYEKKHVLDVLFNISLFVEDYFHTELKSKSFIFSERFI